MPHNVWAPRSPVGVASGGPRSFPQLQGGVELSLAHTWLQDKADLEHFSSSSKCEVQVDPFSTRSRGHPLAVSDRWGDVEATGHEPTLSAPG